MGNHYHYRLSLGNRTDDKKYYKNDKSWDEAEAVLREVLVERKGAVYVEAEDEAAFYGPKIDVQMKNVNGKEDTAFTNQYDFVMPKRFEMSYTNEKGEAEEPVVIHRASLGAIERTMAFLIEHFAGAFPVWLSPVQAIIIPISDDQQDYAAKIAEKLESQGVRVEISAGGSMQNRIRKAEKQKTPYMLVVGEKEVASDSVAVRARGEDDRGVVKAQDFIDMITQKIKDKSLEL